MKKVPQYTTCPNCGESSQRIFTTFRIGGYKYDARTNMNADAEIDIAEDFIEHRLYLEDQEKVGVNHKANLDEV